VGSRLRLRIVLTRVCVFAASADASARYRDAAIEVGTALAEREIAVVYGGVNIGLMAVVADAALAVGGEAIGVVPDATPPHLIHRGLTALHSVPSMHARKARMAELSDAFLALPGGFGTFEEVLEAATWTQLGIHAKPCGILNVDGYFDDLLNQLARAEDEGFLRSDHRKIVLAEPTAGALLERLSGWTPPIPKRSVA
jgi:uncharacterized protein (TIGR00730 family)